MVEVNDFVVEAVGFDDIFDGVSVGGGVWGRGGVLQGEEGVLGEYPPAIGKDAFGGQVCGQVKDGAIGEDEVVSELLSLGLSYLSLIAKGRSRV